LNVGGVGDIPLTSLFNHQVLHHFHSLSKAFSSEAYKQTSKNIIFRCDFNLFSRFLLSPRVRFFPRILHPKNQHFKLLINNCGVDFNKRKKAILSWFFLFCFVLGFVRQLGKKFCRKCFEICKFYLKKISKRKFNGVGFAFWN
jgi:hypothetical protein